VTRIGTSRIQAEIKPADKCNSRGSEKSQRGGLSILANVKAGMPTLLSDFRFLG
jgi:hypothetical protein